MGVVLFSCGLLSVLTTVGIVVVLVIESAGFFRQVPLLEFLTGTRWAPLYRDKAFGILPLLNGTAIIAVGASVVAPESWNVLKLPKRPKRKSLQARSEKPNASASDVAYWLDVFEDES